ncbi:MAG: site-2 protease family protein [Caldilineae bacterium]|nr:MAG: site-2 protease family protein [Caldilineae bacterium]
MTLLISFVLTMVVLVISIAIHEFSHAITADRLGDPTPRMQGRITLNPIRHLDPTGTLMIVLSSMAGFGIGWGKPVQVQPRFFRNVTPRAGMGIVAAAGPVSNIILALLGAIVVRALVGSLALPGLFAGNLSLAFLSQWIIINIVLALFNLIPVFPLDGYSIFVALLESFRQDWSLRLARLWQQQVQYGPLFLFLLLILDWQMPAISPIRWLFQGPGQWLIGVFLGG